MKYTYYKGTENSRERVEFETIVEAFFSGVICTVDVDLLLCGVTSFRHNLGEDVKLTLEQQMDILLLVQQERDKFIHKTEAKSMEDWENSGLGSFDEYFFPGDTVADDVYDNFLNILPPASMRQNLLQVGEPAAHEKDPETGKYRATYLTFVRTDGLWWYAGECFLGEKVNRRTRPARLEKAIAETKAELEKENRKGERL